MKNFIDLINGLGALLELYLYPIIMLLFISFTCIYSYKKYRHYAIFFPGMTRFLNKNIIIYVLIVFLLVDVSIFMHYLVKFEIFDVVSILIIMVLLIYKISTFGRTDNVFNILSEIVDKLYREQKHTIGNKLKILINEQYLFIAVNTLLWIMYVMFIYPYASFEIFIVIMFFLLYFSQAILILRNYGKYASYIMQVHLILSDFLLILFFLIYNFHILTHMLNLLLIISYVVFFHIIYSTIHSMTIYLFYIKTVLRCPNLFFIIRKRKRIKVARLINVIKEILYPIRNAEKVLLFIRKLGSNTWQSFHSNLTKKPEIFRDLNIAEIHGLSLGRGFDSLYRMDASAKCISSICFKEYKLLSDRSILFRGIRELLANSWSLVILIEDLLDFMESLGGFKEAYRFINSIINMRVRGGQKIIFLVAVSERVPKSYGRKLRSLLSSIVLRSLGIIEL